MSLCSLNAKEASLEEEWSTILPPLRIQINSTPYFIIISYTHIYIIYNLKSHGSKHYLMSSSYACLVTSKLYPQYSSNSPLFSFSLHAIISISFYFTFFAMTFKLQHLLTFIFWILLFFTLFHMFFGFTSNINISRNNEFPVSKNRKILATGFDFTPFINRQRQHHRHHRHHDHHHRSHTEIDPRYGVDKRLVPTGPNPLHH